jgi:cystathionine beta-lyase
VGELPIVVDNTWATPFYYNPLKLGADVAIHSTSKYIAGHSDSIMGCMIFKSEELYLRVREVSRALGQYAAADDINLALRGLRTLGVRMERHYQNALKIANYLLKRKEVEVLFYAPLTTDPNFKIWKQSFRGAGGVLSFIFKPEYELYYANFLNNLKLISLGWGWGGYESLASVSKINSGKYANRQIIRLSIGLEATKDIIKDLEGGLSSLFYP